MSLDLEFRPGIWGLLSGLGSLDLESGSGVRNWSLIRSAGLDDQTRTVNQEPRSAEAWSADLEPGVWTECLDLDFGPSAGPGIYTSSVVRTWDLGSRL